MTVSRPVPDSLFRHPDFLRLWAAQAGSAIGSRISRTALPVIAVLVLSCSAEQVALLSALTVLPAVIVGMLFSGYIERSQKQRVMLACDLLRAALLVLIPTAALFGRLNIFMIDTIAFLQGAATSAFRIADASFLPVILEEQQLIEGNAKFESTDAVAEAAGPGLAGFLIQILGAPAAILFDAGSYLWSAFWLGRIRSRHQASTAPTASTSVVDDIVVGWRASLSSPLLAGTLMVEILTSLSNGFFMALYMLLALRQMALAPGLVGLIIGVGGMSGFAAALAAPALSRTFDLVPLLILCLVVGQAADFLIAFAPSAGRFGPALLVGQQLLGDGFGTLYAIYAVAARQRFLDVGVLARANATFQVVSGFALPLGAVIAGIVAEQFGIRAAMVLAGLVGIASAITLLPAMRSGDRSAT